MKRIRSKEEWAELVTAQRTSGKSVAVFCRKHGIHPNLFYRKQRTLSHPNKIIQVTAAARLRQNLEIAAGGLVIRLEMPIEDAMLVRVLRCIKEAENAVLS
jgi:transposase-like protein